MAPPFTPGQLEAIHQLCRDHGVLRLRLTGSRAEPGMAREDSDFDFLVVFGEPPEGMNAFSQLMGMLLGLENLLQTPCDLIPEKMLRPWWRESLESGAQSVFAA